RRGCRGGAAGIERLRGQRICPGRDAGPGERVRAGGGGAQQGGAVEELHLADRSARLRGRGGDGDRRRGGERRAVGRAGDRHRGRATPAGAVAGAAVEGEGGGGGVGAGVGEVGADGGRAAGGEGAVPGGVGDGDVFAGLGPVPRPPLGDLLVAGIGVAEGPGGDRRAVVGDVDRDGEPGPPVTVHRVRHLTRRRGRRGRRLRRRRRRAARCRGGGAGGGRRQAGSGQCRHRGHHGARPQPWPPGAGGSGVLPP